MKFLKRWLSDAQLARPARPARPRLLNIELLEDRTVPAVTIADAANVQGPVQSGNPSTFAGGYDPQALVNPIRSGQIIAVNTTGTSLQFQISDDFGTNWYGQSSGIVMRQDPTSYVNGALTPLTNIDSPSIAFDRTDHFYVAYIQRNAANTAGAVMVEKYSLILDSLTGRWNVRNLAAQRHVLYQWAGQDPAFNTSIAINTDPASVTDPTTGAIQTNPTAGRGVYVAWNTNAAQTGFPQSNTFGFGANTTITPATVWMCLSDDGGVSYSPPEAVSDNGYKGGTGINPTVFFSPSTATQAAGLGGTSGGQLGILFSNGGGLTVSSSNPFAGRSVNDPLTVQPTGAAPTGGSAKPGQFQSDLSGTILGGGGTPVTNGTIAGAITPTGGVLTERTTAFQIAVDLTTNPTATAFDFLRDMEVTLALYSQDLGRMRIELVAPNSLGTVTLLAPRQTLQNDGSLFTAPVRIDGSQAGLPGANPGTLGTSRYATGDPNNPWDLTTFGLVFDEEAARYVNDPRNDDVNDFYIGRYRPEDQIGFDQFYGLSAAQLTGNWTLRITNYKENDTGTPTPPGPRLRQFELKFVARVQNDTPLALDGYGTDAGVGAPTTATTASLTGTAIPALQTAGLQGWYSVAADDSKGSFSPYQGRMYLATSDGTNIYVSRSNNGGSSWSAAVKVNDDSATDGFSQGNRAKFQPTVAVDATTGTVVVMWYDARWDASNARPATFMATSVDGGSTWSANTFLNETKTALDAINLNTVKIEPVPNNLATLASIGNGQALVVRDGIAVPLWTGNANTGGATLMTAATRIGAGARIVQGDMGPVADTFVPAGLNGVSYNDTYTLDGTRRLDAFYIKFDRPVDPSTFTPADVRLQYRSTTGAAAEDISSQILSVQPLDPTGNRTYNSTAAVSGTAVNSVINVGLPGGLSNTIQAITVRVSLSGGLASQLSLSLIAPDGTVVQLSTGQGGGTAVATAFANTTFDDAAGQSITAAAAPFGVVRGVGTFLGFTGLLTGKSAAGAWTLRAVNSANQVVVISNWTLNLATVDQGASRFLVRIAPQAAVGTYSYAIRGDISDRVREVYTTSAQPTDQFPPTIANSNTAFTSTINIAGQAPVTVTKVTVTVNLANAGGGGGGNNIDARDLILRLKGPNGIIVTLARENGGFSNAGTVFNLTTFDDAATPIGAAGTPYNNVAPIDPLAVFNGLTDINGAWTLEAVNLRTGGGGPGGQPRTNLSDWSLNFNNGALTFNRGGASQTINPTTRAVSDVIVSGVPTTSRLDGIRVTVDFTDPAVNGANASDLLLRLRGPNPNDPFGFPPNVGYRNTTITLAYANGTGAGTAGTVFAGILGDTTVFDDTSGVSVGTAPTPYGSVQPLSSMMGTFGGVSYNPNGTWRLEVFNMATGVSSTLQMDTWSLSLDYFDTTALVAGTQSFQPGFPITIPGQASFSQSITVANEPAINLTNLTVSAEFIDPVGATAALDNEIQLTLTGPDGAGGTTTINLMNANGGGVMTAGVAYRYVVFQDGGTIPLVGTQTGAAGVVSPVDSLMAAFSGLTDINGTWTIDAINLATGKSVQFNNWQVVFQGTKATGNKLDQNGNGAENEGGDILGGASGKSTILVSNQPAPVGNPTIEVAVKFVDPAATPANAADLRLTLTGPNGTTVVLTDGTLATGTAGSATAFGNAAFTDTPTGANQFAPIGSLVTAFGGLAGVNGAWTLTAVNLSTGRTVRLDSWSITFNGIKLGTSSQDAFANPTPTGGLPFVLPYTVESLPLIVPGPRMVSSSPGLTLDGTVSYIDVVFDRDMLASSFTKEQVLELRLPTGQAVIGGNDATNPLGTPPNPFTVAANPPGTLPVNANRTFRVSFPTQALSGTYSLLLGPGIRSATGIAMDPNMNAGVELVTGRVNNPAVAGTVPVGYNTGPLGLVVPAATSATALGTLSSNFAILDSYVVTQLLTTPIELRLDVTVADVRNLAAQLVAPDGTVVQLFTYVGDRPNGPYENFTATTFSDFAPPGKLIQTEAAPFTGTFLPQQPLSVMNGRQTAGNWTLRLVNKSLTDTATLNSWGLTLPKPVLGGGVGEAQVDQTTVGFRVFINSPSQAQSTTQWTPIGPTTSTDRGDGATSNGVVTVTATDPSDTSGNTVYAGAANGGLWKTTNFLTLDPAGPTWIPLLDGASGAAMHVTSITILPQNNAESQLPVLLVGTGDADTNTPGLGFLRSVDGGRTFRLIDSTFNGTAAGVLPVEDPLRDNLFSENATFVYKIVVDPVRQVGGLFDGNYIVYAALGGSAATQGLWRSNDSGLTWTLVRGGADCTDFVLAPNRFDVGTNDSPIRLVADVAYATFTGQGVFFSDQISVQNGMTLIAGGGGKAGFSDGIFDIGVGNLGTNPGTPDRILLSAVPPPAGNDPLATRIYQGWLYALVVGPGAALYMTKDFGFNWVRVDLSHLTNDETQANFDFNVNQPTNVLDPNRVPRDLPVYNSLAVDATDPNVVYIGGNNIVRTSNGGLVSGASGVYRVDVSTVNDAHAQVGADNSKGGVGAQTEAASTGGLTGAPTRVLLDPNTGLPANNSAYFNRLRDPNQPFTTNSTQIIDGGQFVNNGENAQISRFELPGTDDLIRNIESVFDPLTRKTRLQISTARGVYTVVDGANPLPTQGIYANAQRVLTLGSATVVTGNRSGNLTLHDVRQTALQPSLLAADLAGLYNRQQRTAPLPGGTPLPSAQQNSLPGQWIYSVTEDSYLNAPGGVLTSGSSQYGATGWTGEVNDTPYLRYANNTFEYEYAGYTQTDPQGNGTIYQYRPPAMARTASGVSTIGTGESTGVFLVTLPGATPISRTNGLFNVSQGDSATTGRWATTTTAFFAVNPAVNPTNPNRVGIVISAPATGEVFLSTDQGVNWFPRGTAATFNNSQGTALAFGGLDPNQPTDPNTFFYNGTAAGEVFVTMDGGFNWRNITAGVTGGRILKIIPNPRANTYDAYLVTATGVFYAADTRAGNFTSWATVTGNLFSLSKPVFGEASSSAILKELTAIQVDWRFAQPVLYAAGDSGVFRSLDGGGTWALYPANLGTTTLLDDGGYLPNVRVTDLDLVYGNLNSTGVPVETGGRNVLVASTQGRGLFAIRLDTTPPAGQGTSGPWVNTAPLTQPNVVTGAASITLNFGDTANPVRVELATLTPNMALRGPNNIVIPFTVTDTSTLVNGVSLSNTFRLDFNPPSTGMYTLYLNTNVRDLSGRPLNQNRNTVNGEIPGDYFIQSYNVTVNQAPTITAVANQGLLVNGVTAALPFTVGDLETPAGSLVVTRTTSNPTVVPLSDVLLLGSGAARTVTVTGRAAGTSLITLIVTDGSGRQTSTSFTVSVVAAPAIPYADNFDRPDASDLGGAWVLQEGAAAGSFNSALSTTAVSLATLNGITQLNSVTSANVTVVNAGISSAGLVARHVGAGATQSGYFGLVVYDNGVLTARIYRQFNGALAELSRSAPLATAAQYAVRFEVINDSLKLFVGGALATFAYDTFIAGAGRTGLRFTNGSRIDDFAADAIALNPPAPLTLGGTAADTFTQATGSQLTRDWRDRLGNLSVTGSAAVGQPAPTASLSTLNIAQPTANAGAEANVTVATVGQVAGLVLRYTGTPAAADTNYYLAHARRTATGTVIQLYRAQGGGFVQLGSDVPVTGTTGLLRFEANGTSLKVFFNGTRVLTAYDAALTGAGGVGLRTNAGGTADNFTAFALGTNAVLPFGPDTFDAGGLNQLGSVWTERAGAFTLASNTAQATAATNLATLNGVSAADVVVSAVVGAQVGSLLSTGVVARYQSNGDMYWATLNVFGNAPYSQYMSQIWKYVNGTWTMIHFYGNPLNPSAAVGKTLRFEVFGSSLRLYLDDALLSFVVDTSITGAGSVGLRTGGGAVLDDFRAAVRAPQAAVLPFADNFNTTNPQGSLAVTWQERSGYFTASAATQRATGGSAGQPNLATLNGVNVANATIDGTFFFTAAGQAAQLVGRYSGTGGTGDSNFYFADIVTQANGDAVVRILKKVGTATTQLASTTLTGYFNPANFAARNPAFRFVLTSTTLSVFVDGVQRLTTTDGSLTTGSVGIRTTQGVGIDDFSAS